MGINLLEFVKNQFSPALMSKIAGLVGEKSADTQKAIDILLPSVLGGLANSATTLTGADNLLDMINEGGHDGRIFDTLGTLLSGGIATQGVLRIGGDVTDNLFGSKIGDISECVASQTGVKTAAATNLMNLAAPLLMGAIGKQLDGKGTASSMISLLGSQLQHLKNTIPNDLLGVLNLSNLGLSVPVIKEEPAPVVVPPPPPPTPAVTSPTKVFSKFFNKPTATPTPPPPVTPPVSTEKNQNQPVVPAKPQSKPVVAEKPQNKPVVTERPQSKPVVTEKQKNKPVVAEKPQNKPVKEEKIEKKPIAAEKPIAQTATDIAEKPLIHQLKPWLILLGAALFGLFCLRTCRASSADAPSTVPVVETPKTDTAAQNQTTTPIVVGNEKTLKLTDSEIKVKQGSFIDLLYTAVTDAAGDTTKAFIFDNVNFEKNKTELTDSSKAQLNDLVKIMKAYTNFNVKINGYTDSRGDADENKKLSSGRAAAVKAYLTAHDIYEERIKTEGFGAANPITSNETEEGRAKNRRIEAKVTKK